MKAYLTKKNAVYIVVALWFVFSIAYTVRDQWQTFQVVRLQGAYQQGYADSIRKVLAEAGKCEPINVFEGDKKMALIEIECLKQANEPDTK